MTSGPTFHILHYAVSDETHNYHKDAMRDNGRKKTKTNS